MIKVKLIFSLNFAILCLFSICFSQNLIAKYCSTKLPSGGSCHRLHYDGGDSILIFANCDSPWNKHVYNYSLASDSITKVGELPKAVDDSSIVADGDGNVFIFKRSYRGNDVLKYNIVSKGSSSVGRMPPGHPPHPPILFRDNNTALIFWEDSTKSQVTIPGEGYTFKYFHFQNATFTQAGGEFPIYFSGGGVARAGGRIFFFPYDHHGNGSVWELDPLTLKITSVGSPNLKLPQLSWLNSAVSDGAFVYVTAGYYPTEIKVKITSGEGILRFNPGNNSTDFIPVDNWPVSDGERYYFSAPQCVYVDSLKRIYCFGGTSYSTDEIDTDFRKHDEIFYVDLNKNFTTIALK